MCPSRTMPTEALGTWVLRITSLTAAATRAERAGGSESTAWAPAAAGTSTARRARQRTRIGILRVGWGDAFNLRTEGGDGSGAPFRASLRGGAAASGPRRAR